MDNATDATTGVVGRAYATYKELYTTKDYPAEGIRVDTLIDTFGLKGENPKTPTQLYQSVKQGGDRAPLLFMMAVRGESLMHVLHQPFFLATPLGATPTSWLGEVLMLGDNVIGRQLPRPFIMPKQLFAPVNGSHKVLPLAQMLHEIETLDSSAYVTTVLIVDDAVPAKGYDSLNVRHACLVPPRDDQLVETCKSVQSRKKWNCLKLAQEHYL